MSGREGQQVDQYRLRRFLGAGTFGEVYEAEHLHKQTIVAIKLLKALKSRFDQEVVREFLREARTLHQLKHPHIVQLLDFGLTEETLFLVMEYAIGGTVRNRFPAGMLVPLQEVSRSASQVAEALSYAHQEHLIHRDVKPQNMLIDASGKILLSDFGLVKTAHEEQSLYTLDQEAGTIPYMAPEQIRRKPQPASDQYSLGVCVYEWITGTRPFVGNILSILAHHLETPPLPLRTYVPLLSEQVEAVVLRALAKNPDERFPDVRSFAEALHTSAEQSKSVPVNILAAHRSQQIPPLLAPPLVPSVQELSRGLSLKQDQNASPPLSQTGQPLRREHSSTVVPLASSPVHSRRVRLGYRVLVFVSALLALLIASSSILWITISTNTLHTQANATATVLAGHATATIRESFTAYDTNIAAHGIMYGFDAQHTRFNMYERRLSTQNISQLVQYWSSSAGNGFAAPTVVGSIVYVLDRGGQLRAYPAQGCQSQECTPLWSSKAVSQNSDTSPLAVSNGIVYINANFKLQAYKANGCGKAECDPLWTSAVGQIDQSEPIVANYNVYVGGNDGRLYAYNTFGCGAQICQPLWSTPLGSEAGSAPAIANGILYIVPYDGVLYAYSIIKCEQQKDCSPLWKTPPHTNVAAFSSPTVANGMVYFGGNDGVFYAYKADGCEKSICTPVWTATTTTDYIDGSPAIANGIVYISTNGIFYAFQSTGCGSAKCAPLWTASIGGSSADISIANGVVYVGSDKGNLYAFNAAGCSQKQCHALWSTTINRGTPAVANGILYVSSPSKLYTFHLD